MLLHKADFCSAACGSASERVNTTRSNESIHGYVISSHPTYLFPLLCHTTYHMSCTTRRCQPPLPGCCLHLRYCTVKYSVQYRTVLITAVLRSSEVQCEATYIPGIASKELNSGEIAALLKWPITRAALPPLYLLNSVPCSPLPRPQLQTTLVPIECEDRGIRVGASALPPPTSPLLPLALPLALLPLPPPLSLLLPRYSHSGPCVQSLRVRSTSAGSAFFHNTISASVTLVLCIPPDACPSSVIHPATNCTLDWSSTHTAASSTNLPKEQSSRMQLMKTATSPPQEGDCKHVRE
ncbi:hypothetical protein B484DRAFT_118184 [Ochromonadaceae sp. CCMP2298]|nr:hypothetical protein B484DRAFT_118184 [Ochromonadaceae sp. CCMP2298]|mmetsp:Transcript_2679/g.6177  ORF Transcript_2679/g.6177 Transcript_2679/m.6177 type:complete len:295 (-) Transcript_2679:2426-3310(-)